MMRAGEVLAEQIIRLFGHRRFRRKTCELRSLFTESCRTTTEWRRVRRIGHRRICCWHLAATSRYEIAPRPTGAEELRALFTESLELW